jgi:exopolysaccharide production protein ExoZ
MSRIEDPADRLLSIHYLRAVAAVMVIMFHVFSHRLVQVDNPATVMWLKDGVAIFFVISGFVMVASTSDAPKNPGIFLLRRLLRIAPLYWFITSWYALVMDHGDWSHLLHSFAFIPDLDAAGAIRFPVVDVGWTLNLEMAFYVLFALSMLLPRRIAIWALCITLATLAAFGTVFQTSPLVGNYLSPFWWEFIAGMLIAHLGLRGPAWCLPLGFALLAAGPLLTETRLLATSLPAALIVASARSLDGILRPWALPVLMGDASYAIYLTHLFVVFPLFHAFGSSGDLAIMIAVLFGSVALGIFVHLAVERPLADLLRYRKPPDGRAGPTLVIS